jgi:hypothetical protein
MIALREKVLLVMTRVKILSVTGTGMDMHMHFIAYLVLLAY